MRDVRAIHPYPGLASIHFHFELEKWDHETHSFKEWVEQASKYMKEFIEEWYPQQECEGNLIQQAENIVLRATSGSLEEERK